MTEYYNSKFDESDTICFKVEKRKKQVFTEICDRHSWNESAVMRKILSEFLQAHDVDLNELEEEE
jgi:hypothetical protein